MWKSLVLAMVICLGLGIGYSHPAQAAKAKEDQARDQVKKGTAAFNLGHFDEAVRSYEEAYRLIQDPALLYNIAQSYRLDRKLENAMVAYRSFLRTAAPDDPNRDLAEKRVADLQRQLDEEKSAKAASEPPKDPEKVEVKGEPIPTVVPPTASPGTMNLVDQSPPPPSAESSSPFYKTWWFWGTVGGAVAAGTITAIVLASGAKSACSGEKNACLGVK